MTIVVRTKADKKALRKLFDELLSKGVSKDFERVLYAIIQALGDIELRENGFKIVTLEDGYTKTLIPPKKLSKKAQAIIDSGILERRGLRLASPPHKAVA